MLELYCPNARGVPHPMQQPGAPRYKASALWFPYIPYKMYQAPHVNWERSGYKCLGCDVVAVYARYEPLSRPRRVTESLCHHGVQVCYARILDSKRKFLEAASRYYELSQLPSNMQGKAIDEEELIMALKSAITCTILAAAGPLRSRMLSTLYKVILNLI